MSTQPPARELKCVHCNVTSTPLWRAGPSGPKTLCNACGVRWKKTGSVIPRARRTISKPSGGSNSSSSAGASKPKHASNSNSNSNSNSVSVNEGSTTYESVFAGLMEVPRPIRARTRTPRGQDWYNTIVSPQPGAALASPGTSTPTLGPLGVYVTETLAPSPSPSPPPLPRMVNFPDGAGFRLVMHVKPDATLEKE